MLAVEQTDRQAHRMGVDRVLGTDGPDDILGLRRR